MNARFHTMCRIGGSAAVMFVLGCQPPKERLNSPPQGDAEHQSPVSENFVHMQDNAMLSEMVISSAHFVPHTTELNTLGIRRLNRYAEILDVYGGTLHYDGRDPEEEMRNTRVDKIKAYLLSCGLENERFDVQPGLNRGPGIDAPICITIRQETNFGGGVTLTEVNSLESN